MKIAVVFCDYKRPGALLYRTVVPDRPDFMVAIRYTERLTGMRFRSTSPTTDSLCPLQLWLEGNGLTRVPK